VDWNVDKPNVLALPADDALVLEESEGEYDRESDDGESTPSSDARWREDFPHRAGQALRRNPTMFEALRNAQVARGESIWGMFADEGDWEFAKWILKSGTTHSSTNKLLELKKVSQKNVATESTGLIKALQIRDSSCTSFHNSRSLFQMIDALPSGPEWTCELLEVEGDIVDEGGFPRRETVELWRRNPVECVQELIGNPEFKQYMKYAPYRLYMNDDGTEQSWDEMATGSWWWDIQVRYNRLNQLAMLMMNG
jgi:Plavaka transposase